MLYIYIYVQDNVIHSALLKSPNILMTWCIKVLNHHHIIVLKTSELKYFIIYIYKLYRKNIVFKCKFTLFYRTINTGTIKYNNNNTLYRY